MHLYKVHIPMEKTEDATKYVLASNSSSALHKVADLPNVNMENIDHSAEVKRLCYENELIK